MIELAHLSQCQSIKSAVSQISGGLKFCTDTRKYSHPSAFVAIPGVKVNPLDMIDGLLVQGCPLVVYQQDEINEQKVKALKLKYPQTNFVAASDSVTFLQELSHHHIVSWKKKNPKNTVFAISGSNGKTTHKEMLSHILRSIIPGKVVATEKNNNNHLGVPLTILEISDQTEMLVLELGSNHPGEIKVLCDIANPNAGLTTNIGATHLEFFGTEEKVFEEEGYLYHAVKEVTQGDGFYLINVDDAYLKRFSPFKGSVTYGQSLAAQARVSFHETGANIVFNDQLIVASNTHITGNHNKLNLITCCFIAQHFYPQKKEEILKAAAEFRPTKNRSEWMQFEGRSVFLDAYNANPSSMKAALEGFKDSVVAQGFKMEQACVVLGDMNELGDSTPQYHADVAAHVKQLGFKNVFYVGRYNQHYLQGQPEGMGKPSTAEFKNEFRRDVLKKFPILFIKGSRSLQLESLFDIT